MEVFTARKPIHATRYIHIIPAVPPLMRPIMDVLSWYQSGLFDFYYCQITDPSIVSQLAMRIMEKPKMETNRKFRFDRLATVKLSGNGTAHSQFLSLAHPEHVPLVIVSAFLLCRQILVDDLQVNLGGKDAGFFGLCHVCDATVRVGRGLRITRSAIEEELERSKTAVLAKGPICESDLTPVVCGFERSQHGVEMIRTEDRKALLPCVDPRAMWAFDAADLDWLLLMRRARH
jgi:hypothetical protein